MGFLDKGVDPADFEKFKSEVNSQLKALTSEIRLKVTDSEAAARASADNALDIEGKIKSTKVGVDNAIKELLEYREAVKEEVVGVKSLVEAAKTWVNEIKSLATKNESVCAKAVELTDSISSASTAMSGELSVIKAALLEAQKLPDQVVVVTKLLDNSAVIAQDIEALLTHSMKKKSEIDELHKSILGAEVKGADGAVERVDGLVDSLERAYGSVEAKVTALESEVDGAVKGVIEKYEGDLSQDKERFEKLILESKERYSAIDDEITGLLPGAMAAGLSAAYEKKKDDEVVSSEKYESSFKIAIALMVAVSLIPFGVDVFLLGWKGADLVQVIKDTPSLIVSILPLYFPVLWFAYSSSKKLNLSKRLIEEYTHKAVLGKTFSGLSNQIESLPRESVVRDELRTRLLFNLLQVSSENPGKLITDYNKSDHPLMDALENSAKLSDSVETLSKLPGFSMLAKKLATRTDELLSAQAEKVESGLATQEVMEKPVVKDASATTANVA